MTESSANSKSVSRYSFMAISLVLGLLVLSIAISAIHALGPGATFIVNTTADGADVTPGDGVCDNGAGHCTLRAAIQEANASAGPDIIAFSITGCDTICTIRPASPLPALTDDGTVIDGTTQTTDQGDTKTNGPEIELDGIDAGSEAAGFHIESANNVVRGLIINRFTEAGVLISGDGASGNVIAGNYIGTDANGTVSLGNCREPGAGCGGVTIRDGAHGNTVGGTATDDRNVISGNEDFGVNGLYLYSAHDNHIVGNYIGTDANGTAGLGNAGGILIHGGSRGNSVEGNVISSNGGAGVIVGELGSDDNQIVNNIIGADASGTGALGNTGPGISISGALRNVVRGNVIRWNGGNGVEFYSGAQDNLVGGTRSGEGNTIANNGGNGVWVYGDTTICNTISGNAIHNNALLGIYNQAGGNEELPPPVITHVETQTVAGTACTGCVVEVFSDEGDEGRVYEGQTTADGSGHFTFTTTTTLTGPRITATATDEHGNTSEFSEPWPLPCTTPECPIAISRANEGRPAVAYNSAADEFLVVYTQGTESGDSDIYAQRVGDDGTLLGIAIPVSTGPNNQDSAAVAYNEMANRYLVVWQEDSNIHGQLLAGDGSSINANFPVAPRPGLQRSPAVAASGNEYMVVWDEDLDGEANGWSFHIYGRRVFTDGDPIGDVIIVSDEGNHQIGPDIVYNPINNEYLVVWRDARYFWEGCGYNDDIFGQRLSPTCGRLLDHDFPISTQYSPAPKGNAQNHPAVTHNSRRNQYLVVWEDERNDPGCNTGSHVDVYGQLLSSTGEPIRTPVDVSFPIVVADGNQVQPDVAYSPHADAYLVIWADSRGADTDIYARFVFVFGCATSLGDEIVMSEAPRDQQAPAVAYDRTASEFLGVWEDHRNLETHPDIYSRRLYQPPEPQPCRILYLPLVFKAYPITLPEDAEDRARAWLDHQTVHFERAEDIPGYNRDGCSGQVVRYKDEQKKICQPATPGDALVSFDYCNYGTPDQRQFLGRYGRVFLYDQAVGAIAWLMAGEPEKARRLLDYLSSYQNLNVQVPGADDGSFGFSFNTVGCPDYAPENRDSFYDLDYLRSGAISWAGYAFVLYQQQTDDTRYLDVARRTADYLLTQQVTAPDDPRFGLLRGGHGTYDTITWDFTPGQIEWVSTEHNVDAYFFLRDLGMLTSDARYSLAAQQIRGGLLTKLWNEEKGRLDQGLDPAGQPDGVDALDAASWGAMFLLAAGEEEKGRCSLAFAERTYWNEADGIRGYKPYAGMVEGVNWDAVRMVWSEGSLGMAMAYVKLGDAVSSDRTRTILAEMAKLQERDPDGGLLYAVYDGDDLTDFPKAPSVGGTGWFVMTLRGLADPSARDTFWGAMP